eukprot:4336570-Pyramimonas_sp.AAC.1
MCIRDSTWNARALFHHNLFSRQSKLSVLHRLLRPGAVVAIQESHGAELEILDFLYQSHLDFVGVHSFAPSARAGGVISFFPKFSHLIVGGPTVTQTVLVPGRPFTFMFGFSS